MSLLLLVLCALRLRSSLCFSRAVTSVLQQPRSRRTVLTCAVGGLVGGCVFPRERVGVVSFFFNTDLTTHATPQTKDDATMTHTHRKEEVGHGVGGDH